MTWTLRLYDGDGTEIAWVQVTSDGSYSYSITHPDSGWSDFDLMLDDWRRVWAETDEAPGVSGTPFSLDRDQGRVERSLTPEEHLSRIQDDLRDYPEVGSTALNDE